MNIFEELPDLLQALEREGQTFRWLFRAEQTCQADKKGERGQAASGASNGSEHDRL